MLERGAGAGLLVELRAGDPCTSPGATAGPNACRLPGVDDCRWPAVMRLSSPGRIGCTLPKLSVWTTFPSSSQVTVCKPMCGCGPIVSGALLPDGPK